jgi:mannose-6-phosphate isomerase
MLSTLIFKPIFHERLWGGRTLETLFGKSLPANLPIGESWEISDRPGNVSVVNRGPLSGRDLHWLVEHHKEELLGSAPLVNGRFPLLVKILDARETLSLQVHPPAAAAGQLGGEPKTEMWFVAHAEPGAELFAGLKRGVTRREFEEKLRSGGVAECFHRIKVKRGDAMFVPSGRVHGIGAGCVIFEIQQNSDTTYRVFDWNRVGPDGQARQLHIPQSLDSIDFEDFEPGLIAPGFGMGAGAQLRPLVQHELFNVEFRQLARGQQTELAGTTHLAAQIIGVVEGRLRVEHDTDPAVLDPGQFCLIPAAMKIAKITALDRVEFLVSRPK